MDEKLSHPNRLLLVVCTGNICRSPMAAALLTSRLEAAGLRGWVVESRGVSAIEGHPATSYAEAAAQELGLDLTNHRGRQFTPEDAETADLILTLEGWQRDRIRELVPARADRVQLLTHFDPAHPDRDIADPYGRTYRFYRACLDEISGAVESVVRHVRTP
jgi:protein-tyrosine-phosphatase